MKVILLDGENEVDEAIEHEVEPEDLKQLYQIADKLADKDLIKLKKTIDQLQTKK